MLPGLTGNLPISSPYSVSVPEGYGGAYLETPSGVYLALRQGPTTKYTLDYMWYTSRYIDTGYLEKELVDVSLSGVGGLDSATLIHLDGSQDQVLSVTDNVISEVLLEGDMPVLIFLEFES